ncbi:MAG: hypothetical protein D3910_08360 [Candidatus Electrothrix sp. ATG2]|nr:hypothetical protein [Candidatus Electrothrix sp. ATG2]
MDVFVLLEAYMLSEQLFGDRGVSKNPACQMRLLRVFFNVCLITGQMPCSVHRLYESIGWFSGITRLNFHVLLSRPEGRELFRNTAVSQNLTFDQADRS